MHMLKDMQRRYFLEGGHSPIKSKCAFRNMKMFIPPVIPVIAGIWCSLILTGLQRAALAGHHPFGLPSGRC